MAAVKTVGIFAKPNSSRATKLVPELLRWLAHHGIEARFDNETARYAGMLVGLDRQHVPEGCNLAIVLGGDGTLLSAARAVAEATLSSISAGIASMQIFSAPAGAAVSANAARLRTSASRRNFSRRTLPSPCGSNDSARPRIPWGAL